ncbi:hypothetical protein OROGR_019360 [Orobanche gracilis]
MTLILMTEALAAIFLLSPAEFLPGWCSSDLPVCEDDANLDMRRISFSISSFDSYRRNLRNFQLDARSLLSHAESLVPRFLNEEDVQLLSSSDAQNTGVHSSHLQREIGTDHENNDIKMEENTVETVTFRELDQWDVTRNGNDQFINGERKYGMTEQGKSNGPPLSLKEIERDVLTFETSGSDSSPTRGKNSVERMDVDHLKRSGFDETLEDEKIDAAIHSDEKQQRKRRRTVMNDKQIALIESALVYEPYMHRNSASLQSWADKLSLHFLRELRLLVPGLKIGLNNRKARLARVAKDVRGSYEVDSLERQGSASAVHLDSPLSNTNDARFQSLQEGSLQTSS